jgi:hypothetical protein
VEAGGLIFQCVTHKRGEKKKKKNTEVQEKPRENKQTEG